MFCPWPLQSDKIMQFSSWRDLPFISCFFFLRVSFVSFLSFLFFSKTLPYLKKTESLSNVCFVFFFFTSFSSVPFFSSLLVFVYHVSYSPLFFIPSFVWPFYFLDLLLLELIFLWTTISLLYQKKTLQLFTFYMHALPLYVLLLFIDLFICCLFFLFLLSLSLRNTYLTLLHFQKLLCFLNIFTNLYVFACSSFLSVFFFSIFLFCVYSLVILDILLFCSLSWTSVFPMFLFLLSFLNAFFFLKILFDLIILFLPFFLLLHTLLSFSKTTFFTKLFLCLLSPFFEKKKVLSPSSCFFTSLEKTLSLKIWVESFWNFRFWTLHIHLHQFNIFRFGMSALPLYSLLLFILYPLFLSFVSPCFLVSFTFFAILIFFFSWSWIVSLTFFFCSLLFQKKTRFCLFPFLLDMFYIYYFLPCLVFLCLEKWFFVFVLSFFVFFSLLLSKHSLDSPFCFLFVSSFKHSVSHLLLSIFDVSEKCCFPTNWRRHLLFFLFLPFFFSSFSVLLFFFFFQKVCVTNPFIFELFLEFLVNPFSLFTFFSR